MNRFSIVLLFLIPLLMSLKPNTTTCRIYGEIIDRNSDTLLLVKATDDVRFQTIKIPIVDNHFAYEWEIEHAEVYHLIFQEELQNGAWRQHQFVAEKGEVHFKLYDSQHHQQNEVNGTNLNQQLKEFKQKEKQIFAHRFQPWQEKMDKLGKEDLYFSDAMKALNKQWKQAWNSKDQNAIDSISQLKIKLRLSGADLSLSANTIKQSISLIENESIDWKYNYIKNNPSALSFYFVINDLRQREKGDELIAKATNAFSILSKKYPQHPYTQFGQLAMESIASVQVGLPYIDFEASNQQGEKQKLSNLVEGELIVLNFWASWCAPCIRKSRKLLAIQAQYKDKGFRVIGVAREYQSLRGFEAAMEREQYTWPNLIDLDDKYQVWSKYNMANDAGALFLIDGKGTILAKNPSIEEILKQVQAL